ncbi:DUF6798 domain-containing protein [Falsiroseomonas sp.]|uniref:DUF6798 domain-containing protein n=1 Tax=Falsiroseomonas sp. TaxID=2870721 RepID=UPI0035648EDB
MLGILARPIPLACLAAALSITIQGFEFGVNNNVFHIPIVLGFSELPQFAADPVIHSLRRFVSPVYSLLATVATEDNIAGLFFLCHVATRILSFLALLLLATALGMVGWRLCVVAAVLSVARGIYGVSPVGTGGMLLNYFTHSELASAFALLCCAAIVHGRLVLAGSLGGLAFAVNAFVGVWIALPLALASLQSLAQAPDAPAAPSGRIVARLRPVLLAALAYAVPALPVAGWVLTAAAQGTAEFDYREFLWYYWGSHFFLDASGPWALREFGSTAVSAVTAASLLRSRRAATVIGGVLLVLLAGILVGAVSHSRLLLNLHLLRADAILALLAAALVATAAVRRLDSGPPLCVLLAALALLSLVDGRWVLTAAILGALWLATRFHRGPSWAFGAGILRRALLAVAARPRALAVAGGVLLAAVAASGRYQGLGQAPDWLDVQHWARTATSAEARFLVPPSTTGFRVGARRFSLVDWKEGATVMWAPEMHAEWRQRMDAVSRLRRIDEWIDHACAHDLQFVVVDRRRTAIPEAEILRPEYSNPSFAVYRITGCS